MHVVEDFWRIGGFYENRDLNCKVLNKYPMRQDLEILVLELTLSKTNWLVIGTCKPPSLSDIAFKSAISNILTFSWSTHDNILLIGDFNMTPDNPNSPTSYLKKYS